MRSVADNQNIVIKKAHKGSCLIVWDRNDYLMEAEKQLRDKYIYNEVNNIEKLIQDLTKSSNNIFWSLKNVGFITDKELKYFSLDHERAYNLEKFYFLRKIHKSLFNTPGSPVTSNWGTPIGKASEFLDSLKLLCKEAGPTWKIQKTL